MFAKTSYRENPDGSPVKGLVTYLDKEQGIQNRCGCEMDDTDVDRFVEATEERDMGRLFTFSPPDPDMENDDLSRAARDTMEEFLQGRHSTDYVLAVHRDTDNAHVHVACAGERDDLEIHNDDNELDQLRETARDRFQEHAQSPEQEQDAKLAQIQLDGQELDGDVVEAQAGLKYTNLSDAMFKEDDTAQLELDDVADLSDEQTPEQEQEQEQDADGGVGPVEGERQELREELDDLEQKQERRDGHLEDMGHEPPTWGDLEQEQSDVLERLRVVQDICQLEQDPVDGDELLDGIDWSDEPEQENEQEQDNSRGMSQ